VVDYSYSKLLGRPWLKDAKVTHSWGNDVIIVQGNGTIRKILVNKKSRAKIKRPQVLVCYDLLKGLIYEKEDLIFEIEPKLLSIGIITISDEIVSLLNIRISEIRINEEYELEQGVTYQRTLEIVSSTTKTYMSN
jgi:hypothetical protein